MGTIVLISCSSQKRSEKSKACDLYTSSLFRKSLSYAKCLNPDQIFVLSAKHGLVGIEDSLEPYNQTLNAMPTSTVRNWASTVLKQLSDVADLEYDYFVFLAGMKYRQFLTPHVHNFEVPLEGMRIGEQLQRLTKLLEECNK